MISFLFTFSSALSSANLFDAGPAVTVLLLVVFANRGDLLEVSSLRGVPGPTCYQSPIWQSCIKDSAPSVLLRPELPTPN